MNDQEERIRVACDGCGTAFKVKSIAAGRTIACPKCKGLIAVPSSVEPAATPGASDVTLGATKTTPGARLSLAPDHPEIDFGMTPPELPESGFNEPFPDLDDEFPAAPVMPTASPYMSPRPVPMSSQTQSQPRPEPPPYRNYRTLRAVSTTLKVMAIITILGWVITTVLLVFAIIGTAGVAAIGILPWLIQTGSTVIVVLSMLAWAELIELAMDVESNTFHAAYRK